jgi:superfamily II DNA or RNA helicase
MSTSVPLTDRQRADLHAALRLFDRRDQQRGIQYLRQRRVTGVAPDNGDGQFTFVADVQGSILYEVEWTYYGSGEWASSCTCHRGYDCKHAYAAAMTALGTADDFPANVTIVPTQGVAAAPQPARATAVSPTEQPFVDLLEQRLGRPLERKEHTYVRDIAQLFARQRRDCAITVQDLGRLGLVESQGYYYSYQPVISGWWDAATEPADLLEFWQYLALHCERTGVTVPTFLRPLTDTALVNAKVAARERRAAIDHWKRLFAETHLDPSAALAAPQPALPRQIRLRLTSPKLTWEFRDALDAPWETAKGPVAGQWFTALTANPLGAEPTTLALLQEVQLSRMRQTYWSGTEPQTLKLAEERTIDLVHRLLRQPVLHDLLVSENGEPFAAEPIPLRWLGRPLPDRPDDIAFELVLPDGTPAPEKLLRLRGQPELAVAGASVFELPPPLPGHEPRAVVVPREALATPAAAKALYRAAASVEGIDLPKVEIVTLSPRFVCRFKQSGGGPFDDYGEWLHVEIHGVSPDGALVQRRNGDGKWTTQRGTASSDGKVVREIEHRRAEAAIPLLHEFQLSPHYESYVWTRAAGAKAFPEQFAAWAERCRSLGVEFECDPELAGLVRPADRARVDVSVKSNDEGSGIDWFDLEIAVRAEDATLTPEEIKLLLKAKGRFVRLAGKGWRRLQVELSPEEMAKLAELGLDAESLSGGTEKQRFHALQLADERIAGLLPEQHAARARERAAQLTAIAEPPVPAALVAELRPYQKEGFHFLAHLAANGLGGVLADDMGLGKTVQALAWLLHLAAQRAAAGKDGEAKPLRVLVVCPKSVVPNWSLETKRFAPSLVAAPLAEGAVPPAANLVVVNYTQLRLAAKELGTVKWDAVILDEGQNIKNPQSQTARAARDLRAAHRIVLTGTPIENRTLDLWSLFAFAMPGLLGTQASFKRAFNDKADPAAARTRLARRVKHFMLRRTKGQVATDLPPRSEEDLAVELEGPQRRLYDAELKRTRAMLLGVKSDREFDQQRFNILQSLLRLRQICCDPRLVGFEDAKTKRAAAKRQAAAAAKAGATTAAAGTAAPDAETESPKSGSTGSAKLEALLDTIEPLVEEGNRVLVFSQFVTMLELIATELTTRGIKHLMLTGQTENRQELVDRFQSEQGEPVFLLSLKAAGSGLNLTAASYVVLYDPWWNPAVEAQAIDRTHRIGQTEQVIAYRLLARGTIEEKIRKLQQAKAELANSIVQEENLASVMSLADLRFVLSEDSAE